MHFNSYFIINECLKSACLNQNLISFSEQLRTTILRIALTHNHSNRLTMVKLKFSGFLTLILLIIFALPSTYVTAQATEEGWVVKAEEINPSEYYGITVANGMIGIISSAEPLRVDEIVLNGVYDYYGRGRVSNILQGFNFATLQLDIDGTRINRKNISDMEQQLDMKKAVFESSFLYEDKAEVTYSLRALRNLPFTGMIELEVTANEDIEIKAASLMEAPDHLRDIRNFYSVIDRPHVKIPLLTSVAESPTGKHTLAASSSFLFEEHEAPSLIHEEWHHNMHLASFTKTLKKGETYSFSIVSSATSTQHFDDPRNEAERLTIFAALEGKERLLRRHHADWEELWESDIIIEGNQQDQLDIRKMLYHLYSFAREGTQLSLSPMGLSGLGYNGHVFWDTEIWMYPPFLMLQPEIAKSIIEYRYERLEQAKMKAFSHGFDGAMFPWESDDVGQESTPVWALTGPFQHHITGVVGIGVWNYYRVSQDKTWLRQKGYPVLKEVADYWISRVEQGEDGKYHINNVVAADEYAENVDNDAFTNGTAIRSLEYASKAARLLGMEPNPEWAEVAANIPILEFENGITREHATYNGETIKQADTNLLSYPLNLVNDPEKMRRNLEYYEQKVDKEHGPAMTQAVYSIISSRLGDRDKAYSLFKQSYKPNERPPFAVIAETPQSENPYFATGAGGTLQSILAGFGGLELTDEGIIQLETPLPRQWKSLTITGVGSDGKTFKNN